MTTLQTRELHELLDSVTDTRDVVVRRYDAEDVAHAVWQSARDDTREAWRTWAGRPSRDAWAVFVAAGDREDAAFAAFDGAGRASARG
jgi:hypothetical protein